MFIKQIDRNELLKPLQAVVGIVERKQPLPILSNVLVKKNKAGAKFMTTDLEIQIEAQLKAELDGVESSITISAKKLQEILRAIPDNSTVSLDDQENKLLVKANKSRFSLQTLPAQDFPMLAEQLVDAAKIEIQQGVLRRLLSSVQYAMAQQDIRYYLNGVLLVVDGKRIGNVLKAAMVVIGRNADLPRNRRASQIYSSGASHVHSSACPIVDCDH